MAGEGAPLDPTAGDYEAIKASLREMTRESAQRQEELEREVKWLQKRITDMTKLDPDTPSSPPTGNESRLPRAPGYYANTSELEDGEIAESSNEARQSRRYRHVSFEPSTSDRPLFTAERNSLTDFPLSSGSSGTARYPDKLDWASFRFKVRDGQELSDPTGWMLWNEQLKCAMQGIGWNSDVRICDQGEGKLASAIIAACKGSALSAISSVPGGIAKWAKLRQVFFSAGEQRGMIDIGSLRTIEYKKGSNATQFVADFQSLVRRCEVGGMKLTEDTQRQFFFNAVQKGAYGWVKRKQDLVNVGLAHKIDRLYDDFCQEFIRTVTEKPLPDGNSHTNQQYSSQQNSSKGQDKKNGAKWKGKGNGKGRGKDDLSNKKNSDIDCYRCGKKGHPARLCTAPAPKPAELFRKNEKSSNQIEGENDADACCQVDGSVLQKILRDLDDNTNLCFAAQKPEICQHFLFDTGSDVHITNSLDDFTDKPTKLEQSQYGVNTGGGKVFPKAIGVGRVYLTGVDGKRESIRMQHLLYIPEFPCKIFSGERFFRAGGKLEGHVIIDPRGRPIGNLNPKQRGCLMWTYGWPEPEKKCGGSYRVTELGNSVDDLDTEFFVETFNLVATGSGKPEQLMTLLTLWHRRLGHCSPARLKETVKHSTGINLDEKSNFELPPCLACDQAKITKIPSHDSFKPAMYAGESIHFDLGEIKPESVEGTKYFELRTDLYSRYREIECHKTKGNVVYSMTTAIKSLIARLTPRKVATVHIDGASELTKENGVSRFEDFCRSNGIELTVSARHNHHQNPYSERGIRVIQDSARAISIQMKIPSCFWDRLLTAVAYVTNRTASSSLNWLTPSQVYHDSLAQITENSPNVPDNSHLRTLGSICVAYVEKEDRVQSEKLEPRGVKAILLGYAGTHNYIVWCIDGGRYIRTPNVIFHESAGEPGDPSEIIRSLPEAVQRRLKYRKNKPKSLVRSKDLNVADDDELETNCCEAPHQEWIDNSPQYEYNCSLADENELSNDPSLQEALKGPESNKWKESLFKEISQLIDSNTITFVNPKEAKNLITAKWVLKRKLTATGNLEKLKSRLVARGFTQREGIDFDETTSTTSRSASWRTLLALAVVKKWKVIQIDFVGAFLLGDLKERIYMRQFPHLDTFFKEHKDIAAKLGYTPESAIRLMKPLYGLKQSGAMWQKKARTLLDKVNLVPLKSDDAVYRHKGGQMLFAASHVDDFLAAGEDAKCDKLVIDLKKAAEVTIGTGEWFLGINLTWQEGAVTLSQDQYIKRTLDQFGMKECRPVSTPMEKSQIPSAGENGSQEQDQNLFSQIIGKLLYAACLTRPDIQFAVSALSRHLKAPSSEAIIAAKRILRYLQKEPDLGIKYSAGQLRYNQLGLYGVADASFATLEGGRSVSGIVFMMAGGPIIWASKLQSVVAQSTTEAEYYAANQAAKEAAWLRAFLVELGFWNEQDPIPIQNDNRGALVWTETSQVNSQKRHIQVRYHYVRDEVENGHIRFEYVPTGDCAADGLTKPLERVQFERFVTLLGMAKEAKEVKEGIKR